MVFSSHLFLFYFLTASLVLYYLSPRWLKHLTLTAVSYVFYGWANPLFVVLMFVSTLIDYVCGLALVGQLREEEQDVFWLCGWSELSYEQAATALGVPVGTVPAIS